MRTKKSLLLTTVGVAGVFLISGCTTVNSVENAQPVAQKKMISDKRIITDSSLNRHVNIVGINTSEGDSGFMKIQVEVANQSSSPHSFTYRVEWFDENGMLISTPTTSAIPRSIEGKESIFITATAPTARAKDFRIKFLEPTN
jgi:uncharacterized protein YcfL